MSRGTTKRGIRMEDELWHEFLAATKTAGENASAVVRGLVREWLSRQREDDEGEKVNEQRETFSTVAEVKTEIDRILNADYLDTETRHMDEDWVCESFARSVARGTAEDPVGMAKEIERMLAAELDRWYA